MSDAEKRKWLQWAVVCVVILISAITGIVLPMPPEVPGDVSPVATPTPVDLSGLSGRIGTLERSAGALDARVVVLEAGAADTPIQLDPGDIDFAVRERIAIDTGEDSYIYNGADLIFYSDNHSTGTARLYGDSGNFVTSGYITATSGISGAVCASTLTNLAVSSAFTSTGTIVQGVDGTSQDVTFYSDTAGDYLLWDQSDEALTIIGTNGQDALNIDDGNVDIADDVDVDGTTNLDVTDIDDTLNVQGNVTLQALLLASFADETITDGETLTPTVTTYALDSAGAVTMTLAASASEGQWLILIGDDANTITIADANLRSSDGNAITLGQYDVAILVYQDNEWLLVARTANS